MEAAQQMADTGLATRSERWLAGVGFGAMSLGAGLVWYFDPTNSSSFLPACPLYKTTGFACPGCGLTRGFHRLFHGDVVGALDFNAMIPIFLLIFGFFYLSLLLVMVRGRSFPKWSLSLPAIWGLLVLLLVFGFVRNLPFYPFNVLFP